MIEPSDSIRNDVNHLHILNGDSVVDTFLQAGIGNQYAVWREVLCQGPTHVRIDSPEFLSKRTTFLRQFLEIEEETFKKAWTSQVAIIRQSNWKEITIWFEYDLFCQINMMACINLVYELHPDCVINLINVGKEINDREWITLSQLSEKDWVSFFNRRKRLNNSSIKFMIKAWEIYNSNDHRAFDTLMDRCPPEFKYFPQAIENHYRRFPSREDNLTDIQRYIFMTITQTHGKITQNELIKKLLAEFHYYGYGDLQYLAIIRSLSHLLFRKGEKYDLHFEMMHGLSIEQVKSLPKMTYGDQSNQTNYLEDFTGL